MKDMKTIVTHLCIITATLLSLSGCSDFLDEKPQGNTGTTGNFYKNKEDIEYALPMQTYRQVPCIKIIWY